MDWKTIYPKPYDKNMVDPHTKVRVILMNGIEVEAAIFSHQFHRHCTDNELRRELAFSRRIEQQQQKRINWLSPIGETPLETTIGYEHVAVDLTARLAQTSPILMSRTPWILPCWRISTIYTATPISLTWTKTFRPETGKGIVEERRAAPPSPNTGTPVKRSGATSTLKTPTSAPS